LESKINEFSEQSHEYEIKMKELTHQNKHLNARITTMSQEKHKIQTKLNELTLELMNLQQELESKKLQIEEQNKLVE